MPVRALVPPEMSPQPRTNAARPIGATAIEIYTGRKMQGGALVDSIQRCIECDNQHVSAACRRRLIDYLPLNLDSVRQYRLCAGKRSVQPLNPIRLGHAVQRP